MEEDVLAERILQDLEAAFRRNRNQFKTFEIVPVEHCVQNKCPVFQLEYHLAIESWCTKHIYKYAYNRLLKWRSGELKAEIAPILEWTRVVLLLCQEIELAWNIRKELIRKDSLTLQNELNFSALVLTWKPKSSHAFAHRRWILGELLRALGCLTLPDEVVDQEFAVCKKAASSYNQNYYAWSHRIWVLRRTGQPLERVTAELQSTEEWMKYHVSDHCCFHYRQFLFTHWIHNFPVLNCKVTSDSSGAIESDPRNVVVSSLLYELSLNSELLLHFEGHETLWYHRRFLLWTLGHLDFKSSEQSAKRTKFDLRQKIDLEVEYVKKCSKVCAADSWQQVLIERHSRWLKSVLAVHPPDL